MKRKASSASLNPKPKKKTVPTKRTSLLYQPNTVTARAESKEINNALPNAVGVVNSTTFSAVRLLNPTMQGVTAATRLGRKITMTSLLVKMSIALAPTSTGGSPCRVLIVYDKQTNGAAPAITDVLLANDFHSPQNLNNTDRFTVILDKITDPVSVSNNASISHNFYKQFQLELVTKDTSAGDVTDIITGGIFAFTAQNSAVLVVTPAIISFTRIRFFDT